MFNFDMRKLNKTANKVIKLEEKYKNMSDEELKANTAIFRGKLLLGETMDDILIEAFATVREVSSRTIGLRPYQVQVVGALVLHQGRVAEMKTGEGKTLTETLPAYLNALSGKGVHIVTVNEYLAERDRTNMSPIFEFLGLTTGVVLSTQTPEEKQAAYNADITYITNNEVGFDFLKDHLISNPASKMQRKLNFVIIDEVDSILIDEARTPLIITQVAQKSTENYRIADTFVKSLKREDTKLDEKEEFVDLNESGMEKAEKIFGLKTYTDNLLVVHHINQALKAAHIMKKDKDYVVLEGEVVIVDEHTGRLGIGRRFSGGLHQAIEAKEKVKIQPESSTLATITYQNFFRGYSKTSGMTGTAKTEEKELQEIYGLDVVQVDTNMPMIRIDHDDRLYLQREHKLNAIVEEIRLSHEKGQPVLVGTTSVERSEELSGMLHKIGIVHTLLNAKNHKMEAEIISKAGELGAVTIATNMAGRGTDISLADGVKNLGGLKVVGTERNNSRRVDNQLMGRSGRQGDKGESIFFVSLEDDLLRLFASDKVDLFLKKSGISGDSMISGRLFSKQIVSAQKLIEGQNFLIRKETIKYDDILNEQRKIIYKERDEVLYDRVDIWELVERYAGKKLEKTVPKELFKRYFLHIVDKEWIDFVDEAAFLKQDAVQASYKNEDPLNVYTMSSGVAFDEMVERIKRKTVAFVEGYAPEEIVEGETPAVSDNNQPAA